MKKIIAVLIAVFPVSTYAQAVINNANDIVTKANNIGNLITAILISFAVLWIIYGVVKYLVYGATSEDSRKEGRQHVIWGVIGLFVILSIWGLVAILRNTFATNSTRPTADISNAVSLPPLPQI